jgi:hypothetical protein
MSLRKATTGILGGGAAVFALSAGALWIYNAGLRAGAERGIQASRDIGFTTQSLLLRHLLSVSEKLGDAENAKAQATISMLAQHQYTRLEEDAKGGLLEGTESMRRNIGKVRELVAAHCARPHDANPDFDVCAELAKRSSSAMDPTR